MAGNSEESILKIKKRLPRSKKMRKHSIRSAPTSGANSIMSPGRRGHAVPRQYKLKKEAGLLWNRIPKTPWSSQSSVRCTRNNTPLQGKPGYAMALFSKTLDTLQAHLHPEQSSTAHKSCQHIQIMQQRSSLHRLQPFENWYPKIWYPSLSLQSNGNSFGR